MSPLHRLFGGLRALLRKQNAEAELDEELRSFVESATAEKMKAGMSREETMRQVRMSMGSPEGVKEKVRSVGWETFAETLWQDIRFAVRLLRKSPGFTAVAVLTFGLGIGANTAIFSVVNGVLLNPLQYPHPNQLVEVAEFYPHLGEFPISYPNLLDWVRDNRTFQSLAAYRENDFSLTGSGEPQRVTAMQVSASFFRLLGVKPLIGRNFTAAEDRRGAAPAVMLSEALWKSKFGGSPDILGRVITLDGIGYTVVGVVPANFYFCCQTTGFRLSDVYTPIGVWDNDGFYLRNNHWAGFAVGRLKPGVTLTQAQADMDSVARALSIAYPEVDSRSGIFIAEPKGRWVREVKPVLLLLFAAVGFVLLIACVNVANLLLARSTGRAREFAIRAALGANQGRVIRQLLTESTLLAFAGGAFGLLLAWRGTSAALDVLPQALPRANDVRLDVHVLLFMLAACILTGMLFGLVAALKILRPDLHETLKEGGRGASSARYGTQAVFVVSETALAMVLLIGAGLAIRSLVRLWDVNPGFNPQNVLSADVALAPAMIKETPDQFRASLIQLRDTIASVPGVADVSLGDGAPFVGVHAVQFWIEGRAKPANVSQMDVALLYWVSADYLKVMQTPLVRGRFFTEQDSAHAPHVAVIDENFARKYFPNENAIGQVINFPGPTIEPNFAFHPVQIIGVVRHVMQSHLDSHERVKIALYVPFMQLPDQWMPLSTVGLVARTQSSRSASAAAIQAAIEKMNSEETPFNFESMDESISDSLASRRFAMILLGVFAALALLLATIGIYGVISYVAKQRTHEIGVRMALGAQRSDVLRLLFGQAVRLTLIGVAIGLAAAAALAPVLKSVLFGVSARDPLTFAGVAAVLTGAALLACYIPARRAMKVDPMIALRHE